MSRYVDIDKVIANESREYIIKGDAVIGEKRRDLKFLTKYVDDTVQQYVGALAHYCECQKAYKCRYCVFKNEADENGDTCPFYVEPMTYSSRGESDAER